MIKHIVLNYGLLKDGELYTKVQYCTVYAVESIEVIQFETAEARLTFMGTWLKADIQAYLTANGIEWTTSMTKAQLLELCG
jgi:hypothetical protein